MRLHEQELLSIGREELRLRRLVELNVMEQVHNLSKTSIIQDAKQTDTPHRLYGLVYDLREGLLKDLNVNVNSFDRYKHIYNVMAESV